MNKKNGATLVEVMLATLIMVLVLGALAYGLTQSSVLTETVRNQDRALNAAQEKFAEIANSDLSDIMANYNGATFSIDPLTGPGGQDPGTISVVSVRDPLGNEIGLYDVTITVTWVQRGGREITRTLQTAFFQ